MKDNQDGQEQVVEKHKRKEKVSKLPQPMKVFNPTMPYPARSRKDPMDDTYYLLDAINFAISDSV